MTLVHQARANAVAFEVFWATSQHYSSQSLVLTHCRQGNCQSPRSDMKNMGSKLLSAAWLSLWELHLPIVPA